MLILRDKLLGRQVLSLRTGGQVAVTTQPIINPNNLKIVGLYCNDRFSKQEKVLLSQDIREFLPKGLVVDDHEVLSDPEDLVRLKKTLEINFELTGKPVHTDKRKRLGKVSDYALDGGSLYIQKLYVSQSLIKKLGGSLSVDREQIVEVTDKKIVVKDPAQGVKDAAPIALTAS